MVAGTGLFPDWIRLTPERFPSGGRIGFWAEWDRREPLLPDASGVPTVARLQDRRYRFRASFAGTIRAARTRRKSYEGRTARTGEE